MWLPWLLVRCFTQSHNLKNYFIDLFPIVFHHTFLSAFQGLLLLKIVRIQIHIFSAIYLLVHMFDQIKNYTFSTYKNYLERAGSLQKKAGERVHSPLLRWGPPTIAFGRGFEESASQTWLSRAAGPGEGVTL